MKQFTHTVAKIKNASGEFEAIPALRGATPYEIAKRNGFTGTEEEWYNMSFDEGWATKYQELESKKANASEVYTSEQTDDLLQGITDMIPEWAVDKFYAQMVTRSQTWTVPKAKDQKFRVIVVGGGGAGGKGLSESETINASGRTHTLGGGGGAGGHMEINDLTLVEGTEIDIVCGAGATSYAAQGGTTSFDSLSADGGGGGTNADTTTATAGTGAYGSSGGGGGGYKFSDDLTMLTDKSTFGIGKAGAGGWGWVGGGGGGGGSCASNSSTGTSYQGARGKSNNGLGGDGGSVSYTGNPIPALYPVSMTDACFDLSRLLVKLPTTTSGVKIGNGSPRGGGGGNATSFGGGGGGGTLANGGSTTQCGGGGGGGYFGHGGSTSNTGGGGGGGFFCDGADATGNDGGGGGGFFSAGDGYHGGDGGVLIIYVKED